MNDQALKYTGIILSDKMVSVWHIATYMALLHLWQQNNKINPFSISRRKVMSLARIKSSATYHKYIQELIQLGYIRYEPSYHPVSGSSVVLIQAERLIPR
jgi:hypothetical protein